MRELQGIQAYAVVSKQMELKEGQVFVKANAIKTRGLKQDWKKKKKRQKLSKKQSKKRIDPSSRAISCGPKEKGCCKVNK